MKRLKGVIAHRDEARDRWYIERLTKSPSGGEPKLKKVTVIQAGCAHCDGMFWRPVGNKSVHCSPACKAKARAKVQKAKRQASPSKKKAEADRLFSLIVRSVGYCQSDRDDHNGVHQCAHGFSRRYLATRWERWNAFCFCQGCHKYYTVRPLEWEVWLREQWGECHEGGYPRGDLYDWRRQFALIAPNPDIDEVLARLRAEWREIEERAA